MSELLIGLILLVIVSAALVHFIRDVVGAIVVFTGFSLSLSIIWLVLMAPDVALTEAAVGAGVMTVLLLLTVAKTEGEPRHGRLSFDLNAVPFVVVSMLVIVLLFTVPHMPVAGGPDAPALDLERPDGELTPFGYYIEKTPSDIGISNAVAAVLVVFRGWDTLGEAVVVYSALIGALIVLRREVVA